MPKAFSVQEREAIREQLKMEARQCLQTLGMKKTTVDELVKRIHIPKGTFYLFYASKELLFFDVLMDFHNAIQAELIAVLHQQQAFDTKGLVSVLYSLFKRVDGSFLATMIQNRDIELLMRKLPPHIVQDHMQADDLSMERFLSLLPVSIEEHKIQVFSAALRAVFLSMLYKDQVGQGVFDEALQLLLTGIVSQLLEETHDNSR